MVKKGHQKLVQIIGMALVPLLLVGCSTSSVTPTRSSSLGAGWTLYEKPVEGFGIALPTTWRQIDVHPQTEEAKVKASERQTVARDNLLVGLYACLHIRLFLQLRDGWR